MYDQEFTKTTHKEGVSPYNNTETFDITGTTSGMSYFESSYVFGVPTTMIHQEFRNGRIYRDSNTNQIAGMSEAMSIFAGDPNMPQSHGFIPIDYNGFTSIYNGVNQASYKPVMRDFNTPPHALYATLHAGYSGTAKVDYDSCGCSVGVTFPDFTTNRNSPLFKSGIENFKPEGEAPDYVPPEVEIPEEVIDPLRKACGACANIKYPNARNGVQALASIPLGGQLLRDAIASNRVSGLYSVTGIDVLVENRFGEQEWIKDFGGYKLGSKIYMTETSCVAAWAGLFAHELTHILKPCELPLYEIPENMRDTMRGWIGELWAYERQVQVLTDLYNANSNFKPDIDNILAFEPFNAFVWDHYEGRKRIWKVDEDAFFDWIKKQKGYEKNIYEKFYSETRFRINDKPNGIEFLWYPCIPGQCDCQCHQH